MEAIEVQIFDEINDYTEKIGIMTFRQWIFAALIVLLTVPTYIFLPKYTFISSDIASYIVILEAGILGFIGFIKIHNLSAEKIIPYWYRHYFAFNKPIKYMTMKEYQEQQEEKKNKHKKDKNKIVSVKNNDTELTPKQKKAKAKQDKALEKARKKYGYMFKDDTATEIQQEHINQDVIKEDASIDVEKDNHSPSKNYQEPFISENAEKKTLDKPETATDFSETTLTNVQNNSENDNKDESISIDEGYKVLEKMTEDEKKALMKLLGGLSNH